MFMRAVHPGQVLKDELEELGITPTEFSRQIEVPPNRVSQILSGRRAITADTDLRLCRLFGLSSGYWLRAQAAHDTEVAARTLAKELAKIKPWDDARNVKRGRPRTGRAA